MPILISTRYIQLATPRTHFLFFVFVCVNFRYIPVGVVGCIYRTTMMLYVMILARIILKEKITIIKFVAVILSIVGVILVIQPAFLFGENMQVTPQTSYFGSQTGNGHVNSSDVLGDRNGTHVSPNQDIFNVPTTIGKVGENLLLINNSLNVPSTGLDSDLLNVSSTSGELSKDLLPKNGTFTTTIGKYVESSLRQNYTINVTLTIEGPEESSLFRSILGYSLTVAAALSYGSLTVTQKAKLQHIKPVDISFFAAIPKTLVPLAVCLICEDLTFPTQLFPVSLVLGESILKFYLDDFL